MAPAIFISKAVETHILLTQIYKLVQALAMERLDKLFTHPDRVRRQIDERAPRPG